MFGERARALKSGPGTTVQRACRCDVLLPGQAALHEKSQKPSFEHLGCGLAGGFPPPIHPALRVSPRALPRSPPPTRFFGSLRRPARSLPPARHVLQDSWLPPYAHSCCKGRAGRSECGRRKRGPSRMPKGGSSGEGGGSGGGEGGGGRCKGGGGGKQGAGTQSAALRPAMPSSGTAPSRGAGAADSYGILEHQCTIPQETHMCETPSYPPATHRELERVGCPTENRCAPPGFQLFKQLPRSQDLIFAHVEGTNCCRKVVTRTEIRPRSEQAWPSWAKVWPTLAKLGQRLVSFD